MKYYYSSAGYIVSPDSRKIARIKEFKGWRTICQDICDLLNKGSEEKDILIIYQNDLEPLTCKSGN